MMQLSPHFSLDEFLVSGYAERHDIDMKPPPDVIDNLRRLCETCLEPLRDDLGVPIFVTSGYRPPALNAGIGGSSTSAHMFGRAADMKALGLTPLDVCRRVEQLRLPFDQIIHEFGQWSHLGIADGEPRLETLTAYRRGGRTRYAFGLLHMSELENQQ